MKNILLLITFSLLSVTHVYSQDKEIEKRSYKAAKQAKSATLFLKYFSVYFPSGFYVKKAQKKADKIIYKDAINNNNYKELLAYQQYIPNGRYIENIEKDKDRIATHNLDKIINKENFYIFDSYIDKHPGAIKQLQRVKERVDFLKHRNLYRNSLKTNNFSTINSFLINNPESIYFNEGVEKLYDLMKFQKNTKDFVLFLQAPNRKDYEERTINSWWQLIADKNEIKEYQLFIDNTPKNMYTSLAKTKIDNKRFNDVKGINKISAYESFIKKHPDSQHLNEVETLLENLLIQDQQAFDAAKFINTIAAFDNYTIDNPYGKHHGLAKRLMEKLPIATKIKGVANGNKIDIHFHVYLRQKKQGNFVNITNDQGIIMQSISGDFVYEKTGNYIITWDVLQDTDVLEGSIHFNIEINEKPFIEQIEEVKIEEEVIEDVSFMKIEKPPIYPGCRGANRELKACFSKKISQFFTTKFDIEIANDVGLSPGRKRIYIQFTVDTNGNFSDLKVRAPHKRLEKEIRRIVQLLPSVEPGKQRGNPVSVKYNFPIVFEVSDY
jgi:hypothetical protein